MDETPWIVQIQGTSGILFINFGLYPARLISQNESLVSGKIGNIDGNEER